MEIIVICSENSKANIYSLEFKTVSSAVKTSELLCDSKPSCVRHRMVIYVQTIITLQERFLTKLK